MNGGLAGLIISLGQYTPPSNTTIAVPAGSIVISGQAPTLPAAASTWDPATLGNGATLSGGNLVATATATAGAAYGNQSRTYGTGPWYFEVTISGVDNNQIVGLGTSSMVSGGFFPGFNNNGFNY